MMQDQTRKVSADRSVATVAERAKIDDVTVRSRQSGRPAPDQALQPVTEPKTQATPVAAPPELQQETDQSSVSHPSKATSPKQSSTIPIAAISIASLVFLALAVVALLAFRQGY